MGTITERTKANGNPSFRAHIRKNKQGVTVINLVETFSTRKAAESWMRRHEARLKSPNAFEAVATRRKRFRVRDLIEAYCAASPDGFGKTKEQVLHSLSRMEFSNLYAEELTAKDFTDLGIGLRNGIQPDPKDPASASTDHYSLKPRSASTVMHYLVTLGTVIRYAGPLLGIKLPKDEYEEAMQLLRHQKIVRKSNKRNRRPTLDELDELMAYFYERHQNDRRCVPMHKIVAAAIFKCHRQDELLRDKWENYDQETDKLTIFNMKHPRETEGNNVEVMVSQEARDIINSMPRTNEHIFPYHTDTVSRLFTEACKILGIEDLRFHDLRHDGISRLFETGLDVAMVAMHSGHRSWQTLERYTHIQMRGDKYENWKWWSVVKAPLEH